MTKHAHSHADTSREHSGAADGRIRSWTGRSALSCATASPVSRALTTGAHRTRVSEMRLVLSRIGRLSRAGRPVGRAILITRQHRRSLASASERMT